MRSIPFGKPMIGVEEKKAVMQVLEGPILTHGPLVKEFEAVFARYAGAEYAVAVSSCTAALHISYLYLGLKPGDEVLVPAQTHVATAHAVEFCGAKPVFIDSERKTGNIDIDQIEKKITARTKAISVVHYLGMPVDMRKVLKIAKRHNLFVVEDCALAIGTTLAGIHAGCYGDIGCFSFYPVKHITTAEGGMLITHNKDLAEKVAVYRAFGIDRNIVSERKISGFYDVQHLGFNYRLSEIGAALGLEQLKRIHDFLNIRKKNYEFLTKELQTIDELELLQSSHDEYQSSYYCHSIILKTFLQKKRFEIIECLRQKGIGTSIYYPQPVSGMTYYKSKYGYSENDFPVAGWISSSSIALPVGPHLNVNDMVYIADSVKKIIREVK